MSYSDEYKHSISDPTSFWGDKAQAIPWFKSPSQILAKDTNGIDRWFNDGVLNTSYLALDHHVEQGRGDQVAIYYDSPVSDTKYAITYSELLEKVSRAANVLAQKSISKGDRVLIYMPMIPEAVIAMLACARVGAIHSVVFGGFAAKELATRIDDAQPKLIISASCGIEIDKLIAYKPLLDEAIKQSAHTPKHCIIVQRKQQQAELETTRDVSWDDVMKTASSSHKAVPVRGDDPLYILYTSGTTGKPKGVVRDNGGHAVAMHYSMKAVYDMNPGEVFWAASDVGWVVGHSYIVYAPLIAGLSTILYEGKPIKTPDAGAFWRVIEEYKVKALFSAPTAFRAIKKEDPNGHLFKRYNCSSLKSVFVAGERLDPPTYDWIKETTNCPVIDHWWQTETGWAICCNPIGIENKAPKPGSATLASPGYDINILDDEGNQVPNGVQGNIAIKLPLPPSCLPTIWGNHDRFKAGYLNRFEGYYCSGDGGYKDEDNYVFVMGRTDDVINVSGHRLSTGEIEEVVASHPAVAECAIIGIQCKLKGQIPVGFVILKDGRHDKEIELEQELVDLVRRDVGALACFKSALIVKRLPKTRSGKILRKLMRQIADGERYSIPSTIDDPASIKELESSLNIKFGDSNNDKALKQTA